MWGVILNCKSLPHTGRLQWPLSDGIRTRLSLEPAPRTWFLSKSCPLTVNILQCLGPPPQGWCSGMPHVPLARSVAIGLSTIRQIYTKASHDKALHVARQLEDLGQDCQLRDAPGRVRLQLQRYAIPRSSQRAMQCMYGRKTPRSSERIPESMRWHPPLGS